MAQFKSWGKIPVTGSQLELSKKIRAIWEVKIVGDDSTPCGPFDIGTLNCKMDLGGGVKILFILQREKSYIKLFAKISEDTPTTNFCSNVGFILQIDSLNLNGDIVQTLVEDYCVEFPLEEIANPVYIGTLFDLRHDGLPQNLADEVNVLHQIFLLTVTRSRAVNFANMPTTLPPKLKSLLPVEEVNNDYCARDMMMALKELEEY